MGVPLTKYCSTPGCTTKIRVNYKYCKVCADDRRNQKGWGTEAEMRFLDGLGTWNPERPAMDRTRLLKGYYEGVMNRKRWGQIDGQKVLDRVRGELGL